MDEIASLTVKKKPNNVCVNLQDEVLMQELAHETIDSMLKCIHLYKVLGKFDKIINWTILVQRFRYPAMLVCSNIM